jgi:hypothetical protein
MASSSGSRWVLSWRWPAVTTMASGRPRPSVARWSLVDSPLRLRPSAWSASAADLRYRRLEGLSPEDFEEESEVIITVAERPE